MLSIKELETDTIIKRIKIKLKNKLFFIKTKSGENVFNPSKNIDEIIIVAIITIVKEVFILSFFLLELGKNLINPTLKPKIESEAINPIAEIIVVAKPTS
jgi:hypothetical protein